MKNIKIDVYVEVLSERNKVDCFIWGVFVKRWYLGKSKYEVEWEKEFKVEGIM